MERSDHVAIEIENPYASLTTSLRSELKSLYPLDDECTIHRVIETLRQLDEKAYTPRMVSIGPIHHGREDLKAMEEYKRRYLQNFLERTEVHLEDFIKVTKEEEKKVRMRYAETIELNSDDFVKMILMDATFIFEVLLMFFDDECRPHDRVFGSPLKRYGVFDDLYMLENQLPFFILEDLFKLANIKMSSDKDEKHSFLKITHKLTKYRWGYLGVEDSFDESKFLRVKHFVDFLRICIVPSSEISKQTGRPAILTTPSVTELHQAGIKFKLGSNKNLFDIRFKNGILEIPRITIRGPLENMMKNLLAFEQSQGGSLLNDYVIFMNYLVNTPKDVELLVQQGIIHNPIGYSERVSTLFHNLVERPTFHPHYFHFSNLVDDLNDCRRVWHEWKANLKEDYFRTPWTTISVIAAATLLVLTFIQTYCSIIGVVK